MCTIVRTFSPFLELESPLDLQALNTENMQNKNKPEVNITLDFKEKKPKITNKAI